MRLERCRLLPQFVGFSRESVGENKEAWDPETNEYTKPFTVSIILFGCCKPSGYGGDNRQKPQNEASFRGQLKVFWIVDGAALRLHSLEVGCAGAIRSVGRRMALRWAVVVREAGGCVVHKVNLY